MNCLQSCCNAGTWVSSGIEDMSAIMVDCRVQQGLDSRLGEAPSTRIERLLLTPDNVLGVRVAVKVVPKLDPRERIQLFDTCDRSIFDVIGSAVLLKGSIHLASAENDAVNVFMAVDRLAMFRIRDDPRKVRVARKVFERGSAQRVTQEGFREEDNKR